MKSTFTVLLVLASIVYLIIGLVSSQTKNVFEQNISQPNNINNLSSTVIPTPTTIIGKGEVRPSINLIKSLPKEWDKYLDTIYGFELLYPKGWVEVDHKQVDEYRDAVGDYHIFTIAFKENIGSSMSKMVYVTIDNMSNEIALEKWLIKKFRDNEGENKYWYPDGKIRMAGENGYMTRYACCGGYDKNYVVSHGRCVYTLGTNALEYEEDGKNMLLEEMARRFKFNI